MRGGFTYRVPYDCTQPCSVKANPWSCSPKYSTMSLRSNSPCTSTSSPRSSWILSVRWIWSWMKRSYSDAVVLPSRNWRRAARTSAVWGNDPIVVVGYSGRRTCCALRAQARAGPLERGERGREVCLPDIPPVHHAEREHAPRGPPAQQRVELRRGAHQVHMQPGDGQLERRVKIVAQAVEVRGQEELESRRLLAEHAIGGPEGAPLLRGAVEHERGLVDLHPRRARRRQSPQHRGV